jgi:S1-C subfamily serine protease
MQIHCATFKTGEVYYALGYAFARDMMVTRLYATAKYGNRKDVVSGTPFPHIRELNGMIIQGMSGGPIIDPKGRVVGINNGEANERRIGLSREIIETYFCKRSAK